MTLVEVIIVMVLSAILMLVMTVQFVASQRALDIIGVQIAASQEAAVAVSHISRVLRFAIPSEIHIIPSGTGEGYTIEINVKIEGGHLGSFTRDTDGVNYTWIQGRRILNYTAGTGAADVTIARDVTNFSAGYDKFNEFNISLTVTKGTAQNARSVAVTTKIYTLPAIISP